MPTISEFYGIKIVMYYHEHNPPHFHAWYEGRGVVVDIQSGIITGDLPPRAQKMIEEWRLLHQEELLQNWEKALKRQVLSFISPLK